MTDQPGDLDGPTGPESSAKPIFILGMLQRTGTNHLWDLFGLHPDVELLKVVPEDHLVRWSPHLLAYVEDVTRCWSPEWEVPSEEAESLRRAVGRGVERWLADRSERRVVTKMPSVEQAEHFFELFDCPVVLIVRDGRSVSESGVRSFGWSYERAFRRWNTAAEIVLDLQARHGDRNDFSVVRYEDIIDKPAEVMRTLCLGTGLDPERYPFDQIESLPVRGSSTLRTEGGEEAIHWTPVERTQSFDPRERWRSWDPHTHRRFAAVAGASQTALGYELESAPGKDSTAESARDLLDQFDVRWREYRVKLGRARRAVKRVHGRV
jgi:hypothetical protein